MKILVADLIKLCHPMHYGCWLTGVVHTWMVHKRVRENNIINHPVKNDSTPWVHAGRIASLVINGWSDVVLLDVGCNDDYQDEWLIWDGNHRVSAAWFRGDLTIDVEFAGNVALFNQLFKPKKIKRILNDYGKKYRITRHRTPRY